ncbi:CoA pyrophosphatase [Myxococcota bacterium]|nr:CoA pyrophosphatase [Myxococcota bacterium]MBU1496521.1 CoA pyrophosphatase [Myxococcota bacterium]
MKTFLSFEDLCHLQYKNQWEPSENTADSTAAAVIIPVRSRGPLSEILFIEKKEDPRYPWSGQIALPGGHWNQTDVGFENTALRELEEETGIICDDVKIAGAVGAFHTIKKIIIHAYAGAIIRPVTIDFDKNEISRVLWVSVENLLYNHHGFEGRKPSLSELIYPVPGNRIWGATARIVHTFLEAVRHIE